MKVVLTKLTDDRHRLEVVRDGGERDGRELVTRELLFHDLLHYSVESLAGLRGGFYGRLAAGESVSKVDEAAAAEVRDRDSEIAMVERTVGIVTGLLKSDAPDTEKIAGVDRTLEGSGIARPKWLDVAFLERVRERMRQLQGQWRATPRGESMTLEWPALS